MAYLPNPNRKVVCCLRCGRDTRKASAVCSHCNGGTDPLVPSRRGRRRTASPAISTTPPIEDDYSEEALRKRSRRFMPQEGTDDE